MMATALARPRSEAVQNNELEDLIETMRRVDLLIASNDDDTFMSTGRSSVASDVIHLDGLDVRRGSITPPREDVIISNTSDSSSVERPKPVPRAPRRNLENHKNNVATVTITPPTQDSPKPQLPDWKPVPRPRSFQDDNKSGFSHHQNVKDIQQRVLERISRAGIAAELASDVVECNSGMYDPVRFASPPKVILDQSTVKEDGDTLMNGNDGPVHGWIEDSTPGQIPNSQNTDDGFHDCPPPPDFVLRVNDVVWREGDEVKPNPTYNRPGSKYEAIPPPANSDVYRQTLNTNSRNKAVRDSGQGSAEGDKTTNIDDFSDADSDEFNGFGDLITEEESNPINFNRDTPQQKEPRKKPPNLVINGGNKERAIPATDQALRKTVEDLVQSQLRRQQQSDVGSGSDSESLGSGISGISAGALSQLVAETVDRLMRDKYKVPPSPSTPQQQFSPVPSPLRTTSVFSWDSTPNDNEYVAGDETMCQLRPKAKPAKAIAKDRIHRLQTGHGKPICGERVYIKRHAQYGFGFSISGDSPTYIYSVDKGGPAEGGLKLGDVILKIGDTACARGGRKLVLDLIRKTQGSDCLPIVVARTPELQRKSSDRSKRKHKVDGGGSLRSSTSSDGGRGRGSIIEHMKFQDNYKPRRESEASLSGWLCILDRRKWERRWVELQGNRLSLFLDSVSVGDPVEVFHTQRSVCSAVTKRDQGSVSLSDCGAFKISRNGLEPIYLKAETEAEMYMWIKTLTTAALRNK
eukprot:m.331102 g.331102  ORF g.331102 m.331102 type:complete len:748 (+) comp16645_c0_seq1:319-2562(+)